MLVSAEPFMEHGSKGGPINCGKAVFHRLEPAFGHASEMHGGDMNPHWGFNRVYFEIVLGSSNPELSILTIELGKVHFRKVTQLSGGDWKGWIRLSTRDSHVQSRTNRGWRVVNRGLGVVNELRMKLWWWMWVGNYGGGLGKCGGGLGNWNLLGGG